MTSNWLSDYLTDAVRRDLCTQIGCATCGGKEFREGVWRALARAQKPSQKQQTARADVLDVAKALAGVVPADIQSERLVLAVRCLLYDLWSGLPVLDNEIEQLLAGSWAGSVLRSMQQHHAALEAACQTRALTEEPAEVERRRQEKRRTKQEQHERRLTMKKERDRLWYQRHRKDVN